jgi:hypothetical protein
MKLVANSIFGLMIFELVRLEKVPIFIPIFSPTRDDFGEKSPQGFWGETIRTLLRTTKSRKKQSHPSTFLGRSP